jgi:phosphatidate cytidylyltransferase
MAETRAHSGPAHRSERPSPIVPAAQRPLPSPAAAAVPSQSSRTAWQANMRWRVATAVVLIPLVIALAWLGGWATCAGAALVLVQGMRELHAMCARRGWRPLTTLSIAIGLDVLLAAMLPGQQHLLVALGLAVLVVGPFFWLLLTRPMEASTVVDWALTLAMPLYLGVPLALLVLLRGAGIGSASSGFWWLALLLVALWNNDTAVLLAGHYLGRGGRHKLAPRVSPSKTWEGACGGLAAAIAATCLVAIVAGLVLGRPLFTP